MTSSTLQSILTENNITPKQFYIFVNQKDLYIDGNEEIENNNNRLTIIFTNYDIEQHSEISEEYDEARWEGYIIYKLINKQSKEISYLKSIYHHNSYNDNDYITNYNNLLGNLEIVEKVNKEVIEYEEYKSKQEEYYRERIFNDFLNKKNLICIVSDDELIYEWLHEKEIDIFLWNENSSEISKIPVVEILSIGSEQYILYIYTKEIKDINPTDRNGFPRSDSDKYEGLLRNSNGKKLKF